MDEQNVDLLREIREEQNNNAHYTGESEKVRAMDLAIDLAEKYLASAEGLPAKMDFCNDCLYCKPQEEEQIRGQAHSCLLTGFPLKHLGQHPNIPVNSNCPFNINLDLMKQKEEVDVDAVEDVVKPYMFTKKLKGRHHECAKEIVNKFKAPSKPEVPSQWISVEDRLPENFDKVVSYRADCDSVFPSMFIADKFMAVDARRGGLTELSGNVTHWQEPPEAPKLNQESQ